MIYIFRKEIRKWHTVLWIVLFAFVVGSAPILLRLDRNKTGVGSVNGVTISELRYRQAYGDIQRRMRELQRYAHVFGVSAEDLMKEFFGKATLGEIAIDSCVREMLLDQIIKSYNIKIDGDFFKEELVKTLPRELIDERGLVDLNSYESYLRHVSLTPAQYEDLKEEEFKRNFVGRFIATASYMPRYQITAEYTHKMAQKSFSILLFEYEKFLKEAKSKSVTDEELKAFYESHKERYRVVEKRQAVYWQVNAQEYAKKIVIDDAMMRNYYDKHASSKFRLAPKLQVRHIFTKTMDKAKQAYELAKSTPDQFEQLAKKHSEDASASQGGLSKVFERGTYDKAFEDAAFRLQNKGDLSGIVRVEKGYEIIQLVDRIKASTKSFEEVQPEIVKLLTAKKSLARLKSDLEIVVHKFKSAPEVLDEFLRENNLSKKETGLLTDADQAKEGLDGHIAKRLFSSVKGQQDFGYFLHEDTYIVYQLLEKQNSFIRTLADVKTEAMESLYKSKAKESMKNALKDAKAAFFAGKETLASLSKKYGTQLIQTEKFAKDKAPENLKNTGELVGQMFGLTDKMQLLQYKHKKDYYVAQLDNCVFSEAKPTEKDESMLADDHMMQSRGQLGVFIEFLKRNAKIDVDKKMLRAYNGI